VASLGENMKCQFGAGNRTPFGVKVHAVSAGAASTPVSQSWPRRHRRWLLLVGALLLVAIIALVGLLSWKASSEVLVPDHSGPPADATVERVLQGKVILSRSEETLRPGVYGIDWQGGHAIAGEVLGSDASTVTRRLRRVRGHLMAGLKVAIDNTVYAGNPEQALGLPFSEVRFSDELGPMPAWLIPGQSRTWAIIVHGINRDRRAGLRVAPTLHRAGLPALLISYREDLGAPASPDSLHHMGLTEWLDLQAAVRYALAHGARHLVLFGYSMGGAIVSQFMERSSLAGRVAGLVLEAPALDWKAILSFNATQRGLPSFAADPVEWIIGERINTHWESLDALEHPEDFHVPILLFHGTEDKTVPISTSEEFAAGLRHWVTFYRVPKAGHAESWNVGPGLYDRRLESFLRHIGA
jgi:uncharacterized protein